MVEAPQETRSIYAYILSLVGFDLVFEKRWFSGPTLFKRFNFNYLAKMNRGQASLQETWQKVQGLLFLRENKLGPVQGVHKLLFAGGHHAPGQVRFEAVLPDGVQE